MEKEKIAKVITPIGVIITTLEEAIELKELFGWKYVIMIFTGKLKVKTWSKNHVWKKIGTKLEWHCSECGAKKWYDDILKKFVYSNKLYTLLYVEPNCFKNVQK